MANYNSFEEMEIYQLGREQSNQIGVLIHNPEVCSVKL